jgi:hypothetical protein
MHLSWELAKCAKPDCLRQVKAGVGHCCTACATAAAGRHETHQHSDGCEQRHAMRGPWPLGWRWSTHRVTAQSANLHGDPPPRCGPVRGPGRNASHRAGPGRYDTDPHAPAPSRA